MIKRIRRLITQKARHLLYLLWSGLPAAAVKPDPAVSIDVVIPAIENDLAILPLCIEGLRKNVVHPINNIYLVSPPSQAIIDFADRYNVTFLNEASLLGYAPSDIDYTITAGSHKGLNRSGWIFQQLVKLSGCIGTGRYYLAIDADHILLKPHVFITADHKKVFYQSSEYNPPYYKNIKKLLQFYPVSWFSYVSHKMIFDKEELKNLHREIEANNGSGLSWDKAVIASLDSDDVSGFSEFELFGNYVAAENKRMLPWKEKMLTKNMLADYESLRHRYPKYLSVTFPAYLNKKRSS